MDRVVVIGPRGAGKSKLSRRLAEITGLPHIELDKLRFKDDGHPIPIKNWTEITEKLIAGEKWILEGPYMASLDLRLSRADTVIVVQPRRIRCFYQWIKREIRSKDQWLRWRWVKPLQIVWSWGNVMMPRIWAKIEVNSSVYDYRVHHLLNLDQIAGYLRSVEK
ncbi:MAG TPA: hypothetical protein EYQ61_09310 [Dehalococcoidia bacterium]|jgi:adenylate kinase family enzyme|nr:hypothetical protein [Dehalococcoidia bacterium]HIK88039.1 hypothetical protein [Dehalococcoidia bacterium]